jgi:septal ring factor EnvC (AmiA/AmiB activator)
MNTLMQIVAAAADPQGGFDPTPIVVAVLAGVLGAVPGTLAYRASSRANDVNARKVDQEAYDRAVLFYTKQLDDANKQMDRVRVQIDTLQDQLGKVNTRLIEEQEASVGLRVQLRGLQSTVDILNRTIDDLKLRLEMRVND